MPIDILHSFSAIVTVLVTIGLYLETHRLPTEGAGRTIRNHLTEMTRAWSLLAVYYAARIVLPALHYPANISKPLDNSSPLYSFLFHLFVMAVCAGTNILLRLAIVELELVYRKSGEPLFPSRQSALRALLSQSLKVLTDVGILGSFIISLSLLMIPIVVTPETYALGYIMTAYCVQLIVSSALFFRLSLAYWMFQKGHIATVLAIAYGTLQLMYPLQLAIEGRLYEYILTIAKLALAFAIGVFASSIVRTVAGTTEKTSLLKEPPLTATEQPDSLQRLGERLAERARIRSMFQICMMLLALVLIGVIVDSAYPTSIAVARRTNWSPPYVLALRLLWAIPSLLLLQGIAYIIFFYFGFSVAWKKHCAGALKDLMQLDGSEGFYARWQKLTFTPIIKTDQQKLQVILIHGIFSRGDRCWGLLPAILIDSGLVSRVHLMSYSHHLWSTRRALNNFSDELIPILGDLVSTSPERSVVFAHSLGGLLAMRSITKFAENNERLVLRKIKHLVCVAPPLTGSRYSALGWPWAWPSALSRGSTFITTIVETFSRYFLPPGYISGEESALCTCTFFYGIRDAVAGSDIKVLNLPGKRVPVPTWHSAGAVYYKRSPQAASYLAELSPASRSIRLMEIIASNLIGKRTPRGAYIFELFDSDGLQTAQVWGTLEESWDDPVPWSGHGHASGRYLSDELRRKYDESNGEELADWDSYWGEVLLFFETGFKTRELMVFDWPDGENLYLFANRDAGFAIILRDQYREVLTAGEEGEV